jgi:selenocysteine-specific elongation factor
METLGGGEIVDAHARRLRRFRPEVIANLKVKESGTAKEVVMALLETKQPLELTALATQSNIPSSEAALAVESLVGEGRVIALGEGEHRLLLTASGWKNLSDKALAALGDYHKKYPARPGMPKAEFATRLKLGNFINLALESLIKQGALVEEGGHIRLPTHTVKLTAAQQDKITAFLKSLESSPYAPPSELIPEPDLLNILIGQGKVVKVSDNIVFSAKAYDEMKSKITARIKQNGKITLGEVRDMFGSSRKYVQALLEYLDREKVTKRVGDDRLIY